MEAEIKTLMRQGIAEMKGGNRAAAHAIFLQVVQKAPRFVPGLVYAGVTAEDEKQTESFLRAAQQITPGHPAVRRGWEWLQSRRKTRPVHRQQDTPRTTWVARSLTAGASKKPKWWAIAGGTLVMIMGVFTVFLMIVLATFYYLNFLRPGAPGGFQYTLHDALTVAPPSMTPRPSASPSITATFIPSPTASCTLTPTAHISPTVTLPPAKATELAYPPVSFLQYHAAPQNYIGKTLQLSGEIVWFGDASLDGESIFALLLGPLPDEPLQENQVIQPVLVLGIAPDPDFDLESVLTVYGIGGEDMETLLVQGVDWNGMVFLAEGVIGKQE